jgi:protein-S-isoprenylcysteine O-methyltransferase Ste14
MVRRPAPQPVPPRELHRHRRGLWLIAAGWKPLYEAARQGVLATSGTYERVRHPQYDGFLLIMIGFLLQWPTIPTVLTFPVLVIAYRRLAWAEEREVEARFGQEWRNCASRTPAFVPRSRTHSDEATSHSVEAGVSNAGRTVADHHP